MHQEGLQDRSFETQRSKLKKDDERSGLKNSEKKPIRLEEIHLPQKMRIENNTHSSSFLHSKPLKKSLKIDIPNNSLEILAKTWSQLTPRTGASAFSAKRIDITKLENNSALHSTKRNKYEEDVKQLDKWQADKKKNQTDVKYSDMFKPSPQTEDQHTHVKFPRINTNAIDRILKDSDDEDEMKRPRKESNAHLLQEVVVHERKETDLVKSLDLRIREGKEDIAKELMIKKLKQYVKDQDLKTLSTPNFRNEMQEVAKNAIESFQSLKGTYFRSSVDECVQLVTENRIQEMDKFRETPMTTNFQKEKARKPAQSEIIVNYKDIEEVLTKNLEKVTEAIKNIYHKKSNIVLQTRKLLDEQKSIIRRLEKDTEVPPELLGNSNAVASEPSSSTIKRPKIPQTLDQKIEKHNQKSKNALKAQQVELLKKVEEIKKTVFLKEMEIQNLDLDIKTAKENKTRYKLQIRDLYFDLLKDEVYLIKGNHGTNLSWVIHALLELNEEVEDHIFPNFLDKEAIKYFQEFARTQYFLLQFCQEQNLLHNILKFEKYGHESAREFAVLAANLHQKRKSFMLTGGGGGNVDSSPEIRPKSQNSLLNDFRERMRLIKGENLKVKERPNLLSVRAVNKIPVTLKYFDTYNMNTMMMQQQRYDSEDTRSQITSKDAKSLSTKEPFAATVNPFNEEDLMNVVENVLAELESMRNREKQRLIKKSALKDINSPQEKEAFLKIFIFLFGRLEAEENYYLLLKEKRIYNQRAHNKEMPSKNASAKLFALPPRKITILSESLKPSSASVRESCNLISKEKKFSGLKSGLQSPKNFDFGHSTTRASGFDKYNFSLAARVRTLE